MTTSEYEKAEKLLTEPCALYKEGLIRNGIKPTFELRVGQEVVFKQAAEHSSVEMLDLFYEEVENNPDKLVEIVKVDVVRSTISSQLLNETKGELEKGTL